MKIFYATPAEWRDSCVATIALIVLCAMVAIRECLGRLVIDE